jgi:UDP-N-acetyl-2-amino-2-deoxyglucuronate dehydrogenase
MKKNFAIVGCGRISEHHIRAVQSTNQTISAICDKNVGRSSEISADLHIPIYNDFRTMLEKHPEIDFVSINTPSGMHYQHAKEVLERFKRSVILEKPPCLDPDQLLELQKIAETRGLKIVPVFQNRFNKAIKYLKNELAANKLGKIFYINVSVLWSRSQRYYDLAPWRGTWALDGGCLTNQGIHHIDIVRHLFGQPKNVYGVKSTSNSKIEVEDTFVGSGVLENGALLNITVTTAVRPDDIGAYMDVFGSTGYIRIGGCAMNQIISYTNDASAQSDMSEDFGKDVYGNGHHEIYDRIRLGDFTDLKVSDAIDTLYFLHALYSSSEINSAVSLSSRNKSDRLGSRDEALEQLYY